MSISPARIVLDLHEAPEMAWCWRDDWATGWDSIYGLLSKWAKLNSIDAPALVNLFLRGDTGKKVTLIRNPGIDLRNADLLDRQLIASNLRLSPEYVSRAFTADVFPSGHRKIAEFLRWCPECLSNGFHAAVHQIDYLGTCPIHGTRMLTKCPKCHAQQPYQLNRASFEKPFSCCKCGYIFAGLVYEPATKSLQLDATQASCIADTTKLARYADEVLILAFEVDRTSRSRGHGRFAIAKADLLRDYSQYAGFVTSVLDALQADRQQFALSLDRVAKVGRGIPALLPNRRKRPEWGGGKKGCKFQWAPSLRRYYTLYLAIRRYLWRHVIQGHQKCCRSASEKLWWSVNGSTIPQFCLIAESFLKWRMFWEGCPSPSDLWRTQTNVPRGIVNWINESAPMFHFGWTEEGENWVSGHCFVLKCLSTFRDLLADASKVNQGAVSWTQPSFSGAFEIYWAVCGNDNDISPLVLFTQIRSDIDLATISEIYRGGHEHYAWHLKQLATVTH